MPVVIRTREYDETFYGAIGAYVRGEQIEKVIERIF
jgi:hypothetical protein